MDTISLAQQVISTMAEHEKLCAAPPSPTPERALVDAVLLDGKKRAEATAAVESHRTALDSHIKELERLEREIRDAQTELIKAVGKDLEVTVDQLGLEVAQLATYQRELMKITNMLPTGGRTCGLGVWKVAPEHARMFGPPPDAEAAIADALHAETQGRELRGQLASVQMLLKSGQVTDTAQRQRLEERVEELVKQVATADQAYASNVQVAERMKARAALAEFPDVDDLLVKAYKRFVPAYGLLIHLSGAHKIKRTMVTTNANADVVGSGWAVACLAAETPLPSAWAAVTSPDFAQRLADHIVNDRPIVASVLADAERIAKGPKTQVAPKTVEQAELTVAARTDKRRDLKAQLKALTAEIDAVERDPHVIDRSDAGGGAQVTTDHSELLRRALQWEVDAIKVLRDRLDDHRTGQAEIAVVEAAVAHAEKNVAAARASLEAQKNKRPEPDKLPAASMSRSVPGTNLQGDML